MFLVSSLVYTALCITRVNTANMQEYCNEIQHTETQTKALSNSCKYVSPEQCSGSLADE